MKSKFNKKIACIDIGSSKICSSVASVKNNEVKIIDFQISKSEGIDKGIIKSFALFERSISESLEKLEKKSGESIKSAFINIASKELQCLKIKTAIQLPKRPVTNKDISKLLSSADLSSVKSDKILHIIPTTYVLDGITGIRDPIGMVGRYLEMKAIIVTIPQTIYANLLFALEKSHVVVEGVVASPFASGLGALKDEELDNGVILIDIGGSMTTVSYFSEKSLEEFKVFPFGGINITKDIAYALDIPFDDAERIKTLYGKVFRSIVDDKEFVLIPKENNELVNLKQVAKTEIVKAIRPRVSEMFELINDYIKNIRCNNVALVGNGSLLPGMLDLGIQTLTKKVFRVELNFETMPSHITLGIMNFVNTYETLGGKALKNSATLSDGIIGSMWNWINKNF